MSPNETVLLLRLLMVVVVLGGSVGAWSADIIKTNNMDALNLTSSWVGDVVPSESDVAVWDNTVTTTNSTVLGGDLRWQGIRIADPAGNVTIGTTVETNTLTLGEAGVDLSAATKNLLINNNLTVASNQVWSVAGGRTL